MAEKEELCACLDIVRKRVLSLTLAEEIKHDYGLSVIGLLDDIANRENCIGFEELRRRREEIHRLVRMVAR